MAAVDDPNIETRLSNLENSWQQSETAYDAKNSALQQALQAAQDALMSTIRSAVPVGQIIMLAADSEVPEGFLLCDGTIYNVTDPKNAKLIPLSERLKATWGGNGQNTFAVPELRGVFPRFYNNAGGRNSKRTSQNKDTNDGRVFGRKRIMRQLCPAVTGLQFRTANTDIRLRMTAHIPINFNTSPGTARSPPALMVLSPMV